MSKEKMEEEKPKAETELTGVESKSKVEPIEGKPTEKKPEDKDNTDREKQKKISKKGLIAIIVSSVLVLGAVAAVLIFAVWKPWESHEPETPTPATKTEEKTAEVDYEQKITTADGGEFVPKITEGTEDNLTMRFVNLKCSDGCKNVEHVQFKGKTLKLGEDYEVKSGSVILVIFAKVFSGVEPGEAKITFDVKEDDKVRTIGVKITIEKKKEEEKDEEPKTNTEEDVAQNDTGSQSNSNTQANTNPSSQSSENSSQQQVAVDPAKEACESKTGPVGVSAFYFLTAADKEEWLAEQKQLNGSLSDWDRSIIAKVTSFYGGPTRMVYVDGYCRPTLKDAGWTGAGAMPISEEELNKRGIATRTNFVSWTHGDGSVETMVMANPNAIWSW